VRGLILAALLAAAPAAAAPPPAAWTNNCQMCHQTDGGGLAGQFPRLKGRAPKIAATAEGRAYIASVVINGMAGSINVDGQSIMGVMPGFKTLTDAQLVQALGHVGAKLSPAELAAARKTPMGSSALLEMRAKLVAAGVVP